MSEPDPAHHEDPLVGHLEVSHDPFLVSSEAAHSLDPVVDDPSHGLHLPGHDVVDFHLPFDSHDPLDSHFPAAPHVGVDQQLDVHVMPLPTDLAANAGHATPQMDHSLQAILGHPEDYQTKWFHQPGAYDCGPASMTQIIEEIRGGHTDETGRQAIQDELTQWAGGHGLIATETDPRTGLWGWAGMHADGIHLTLEHFGVPNQIVHGSIDQLERIVAQGHQVILTVDSKSLWRGAAGHYADHAVTVAGIDTARQVVYLSDTGIDPAHGLVPNQPVEGHLEAVSFHDFEQAWATTPFSQDGAHVDGDHLMIVTDGVTHAPPPVSPPVHDPHIAPVPHDHAGSSWVILPIIAGGGALLAAAGRARRSGLGRPATGPPAGPSAPTPV